MGDHLPTRKKCQIICSDLNWANWLTYTNGRNISSTHKTCVHTTGPIKYKIKNKDHTTIETENIWYFHWNKITNRKKRERSIERYREVTAQKNCNIATIEVNDGKWKCQIRDQWKWGGKLNELRKEQKPRKVWSYHCGWT